MAVFTINSKNTTPLSNNDIVVYGGKNGFTTQIGAIPTLCTSVTSNVGSIVLTLSNVHQLIDDNSMEHILNTVTSDTKYVKVPFTQYPAATKKVGSVGYYNNLSNVSLPITDFNLQANTITVTNQPYDGQTISSVLPSTPFYVTLYQPLGNNFSNRSAYISGSFISKRSSANVAGVSEVYLMALPFTPTYRKYIELYLDGNKSNSFTWSGSNSITFTLSGTTTEAKVIVNNYTTPAIERKDALTLSTFNNNYVVTNTSYQASDALFEGSLTTNKYYKIRLNKDLTSNSSGQSLINITPDFEGKITNVLQNTSFDVNIDPDDYPYSYELANNRIYYLYEKNKVQLSTAKVDEFGKLGNLNPKTYLIEATNINRYNRAIGPVKKLLTIDPLDITKVASSTVTEQIFIDTTGGASITVNISFPPIKNRDVDGYNLRWRVLSSDSSVSPTYTKIYEPHDENAELITATISNLNRGRTPGSNILDYEITPVIGTSKGFPLTASHALIGKQTTPAGVTGLSIAQQDNYLIFTWNILQTPDGYVFDIDAKEVEIRLYPGFVDVNNVDDVDQAWGVATVVDRIPFPSTTYSTPISVFGEYTYLLRVRDTSDIESDGIAAAVLDITRPTNIKVYKSYNEREPGVSYITQDGEAFPTSNINPELSFSSYSEVINGGLILSDSSNADNSNGSATGFFAYNSTDNLTSGASSVAEYITQIRDVGKPVKGTVRTIPKLSIDNPSIDYNGFYETIISAGVSDAPGADYLLVDSAFGGIGHVLGFSNASAATVSYNSYQRTLTSGGILGNVYAIRNPGQHDGDFANANSYALITSVLDADSITLGDAYSADGYKSNAWNIASASYVQNFSVSAQEISPTGLFFKPDGTKMYMTGQGGSDVNEYNLSTAWDISSASYLQNFSVASQELLPTDLFFKPDGTKMFVLGTSGDDINEYSLSSAWNISTASYVQNFSVSAQEIGPTGLFFKPDGTKMYITGTVGDDVNEYNLSTAWDISSASYVRNFSVAAQETLPQGICFKPDGTKMYIIGFGSDNINEYNLSTPWNVSTASYVQSFSVAAQELGPTGLFFKSDGFNIYVLGAAGDAVYEYALSTDTILANLTVAGNTYQLINLTQFGDEGAARNFLGPSRSIVQNLFFRYSTSNVFYDAAANGIVGYPNHGNTNPFAFDGAASNAELGWKPYIAGEIDFRYVQLKLQVTNPSPSQFSILLQDFNYEVDLKEKSFKKSTLAVNSVDGIVVDYSFVDFVEVPLVTATPISATSSISAVVSNVSESYCNVQLFDSTGTAISYGFVNLSAIGV